MGRKFVDVDVLRRECAWVAGYVLLIILDGTIADDEAIDTYVQLALAGGLLGGEAVQDEQEIGSRVGVFSIEVCP